MKQIILVGLFSLIIFYSFSQVKMIENWPQFGIDTLSPDFKTTVNYNLISPEKSSTYNLHNKYRGNGNITNVGVSRSPVEVLITKDDQFAFIRCFLGQYY